MPRPTAPYPYGTLPPYGMTAPQPPGGLYEVYAYIYIYIYITYEELIWSDARLSKCMRCIYIYIYIYIY